MGDKALLGILVTLLVILSSSLVLIGVYLSPSTTTGNETTPNNIVINPTDEENNLVPSNTVENNINGSSLELASFKSYKELLDFIDNALSKAQDTRKVIETTGLYRGVPGILYAGEATYTGAVPASSEKTGEYSETNIQVKGVDEPDLVKTNGEIIAVLSHGTVYIIDVSNDNIVSRIVLSNTPSIDKGLFLDNEYLVVITSDYNDLPVRILVENNIYVEYPIGIINTTVYFYNISDPVHPVLVYKLSTPGTIIGARLVNHTVYLVTQFSLVNPVIPIVNNKPVPLNHIVCVGDTPDHYIVFNIVDLNNMVAKTYSFLLEHSSWFYMSHERIYIASTNYMDYRDIQVHGLRVLAKYLPENISNTVNQYLESNKLDKAFKIVSDYLSTLDKAELDRIFDSVNKELEKQFLSDETRFYVFDVKGIDISYRGKIVVSGRVLDQFSMEEMGEYFIVATTKHTYVIKANYVKYGGIEYPERGQSIIRITECNGTVCNDREIVLNTSRNEYSLSYISIYFYTRTVLGDSNNVYVIDHRNLTIIGRLENLAKGERIYSSRLIGHMFYLVTYRRIDPLFAIDLSNPAQPRVIGYIESPGFSEYLHPLPGDLLLGIGVGTGEYERGLKISLYDISDPTKIEEISVLKISPGWSRALYDHHAVMFDQRYKRIYIPYINYIYGGEGSGILVISYANNALKLEKIIIHSGACRTLYVDGKIYTVSYNLVKIFDREKLNYIGEIKLSSIVEQVTIPIYR